MIVVSLIQSQMDINKYLEGNKRIQKTLLSFLDSDTMIEEDYQNLYSLFEDQKIRTNISELKILLYLINKITKNHFRYPNFFKKIEKILLNFKDEITNNITNQDIFKIFCNNKRILLFLIQNKMLTIDYQFFEEITQNKYISKNYPQFFGPEIKQFITTEMIEKSKSNYITKNNWINEVMKENSDDFDDKRNIGENDDFVSQMIRNDKIEDFITYVNRNNYSLNSIIQPSIFETNDLLMKKTKIKLIEYAAFFGSVQIFKYLKNNSKVEFGLSLWTYAVHSDNPELISILEEESKNQKNSKNFYLILLNESIKCHHNDVANYIQNNFFENENEDKKEEEEDEDDEENDDDDDIDIASNIVSKSIKYYNFSLIQDDDLFDNDVFFDLCKYDYISLVHLLLNNKDIDVNYITTTEIKSQKKGEKIEEQLTPLIIAVEKENIEIIKLLLSKENEINVNETKNHTEEYYFSDERNLNYDGESSSKNNSEEETALIIAVKKENIEIIKLLLSNKNIDVNVPYKLSKDTEEEFNSNQKGGGYCEYYSDDTENINKNKTALNIAVENNNTEIVKLLLENEKIDVNYISKYNRTAYNEYRGECYDYNNNEKKTPLYTAIENENIEIIKLLLENKKIDVNIKNYKYDSESNYFNDGNDDRSEESSSSNKTHLYLAIEEDNVEIVELLLANEKIDVNMKSSSSKEESKSGSFFCDDSDRKKNLDERIENTPLHLAVENGNIEIINLLLEHNNINTEIKDNNKKTPIQCTEDEEILDLFKH